jgi:competence protein ComEC
VRLAILSFALGIWLLQIQATLPGAAWPQATPWILGLGLFLLALGLITKLPAIYRDRTKRILIICFAVLLGFTWAALLAHQRLADSLSLEWESQDIEVVGIVAGMPTFGEHGVRFRFDVERVITPLAIVPRHISLSWYAKQESDGVRNSPVHAGERWRWSVRLKRPHGNANPHGFDFEAWLLEQNIRATGYVRDKSARERIDSTAFSISYGIEQARETIRSHMQSSLQNQRYGPVLIALAIGDQSAIAQADWDLFWQTGIGHLISISGLHVTMVAGLIFSMVYFLWRRSSKLTLWWPARKAATIAGLLAALGYSVLAGLSIPTQRTLLMVAVFGIALLRNRIVAPSQVLCAALFVVLLFDPWAVNAAGFWLSFAAVGLIFFVTSGRSSMVAEGLRANIFQRIRNAGRIQWAVTLGLMPLLLAMFQQVSIISPLANAIAIPLISFIVVPLTLIGLLPGCDALLQGAHHALAFGLQGLEAARDVPFGQWLGAAPPQWTIVVGLVGACWLLLPNGFPARWLGAIGLLPLFAISAPKPVGNEFWVTTLDVGQGLAVVVRTANRTLLYDTGPKFNSEADSGNRVVVPYLRALGVQRLDGMMVSHEDSDHSGGALSVMHAMPIDWIAASLPPEHPIARSAKRFIPCSAGQNWQWDGVHFEVLNPGPWINVAQRNGNNRGCVLKVSSRAGSLLLPADIEHESEWQLTQSHLDALRSDVMLAPHHGSKTSSSVEFLRAVHPQIIMVSSGYRNRFGHPKDEILDRYAASGATVFRSDRDGAVTFRFAENSVSAESYRQIHKRYWYGQ